MKPLVAPCKEQFQFGDGNIVEATKKYLYPCFLDGVYHGSIDQASVPVQCPQLLAKVTMKAWDTDLCFGKSLMKVHKFNYEKAFNRQDIPMINIFEVTPEQLKENWHLIPDHYKLNSYPISRSRSRLDRYSSL